MFAPAARAFRAVALAGVLALPELLILLLMIFYLIKTLATSPKRKPQ